MAFVFAYAPQSVFEPYRAARQARPAKGTGRNIQPLVFTCYGPYQVYATQPGCAGCQVTLEHNFCTDNFSFFNPYTEYYYGDVYLSQQAGWAYSTIYSDDNYFSCFQQELYTSGPLSCYASDLRYNTDPVVGTVVHIEGSAEFWVGGNVYDLTATAEWRPYSHHQN